MSGHVTVKRALLSVSDKTGIIELGKALAAAGAEILSTGGTARALKEAGLAVTDVSDHTGFPEIMDGRVKTLQPSIHGGILARRDSTSHLAEMQEHQIAPIDLVVVNLYPFEQTVAGGASYEQAIEQIDIGGPAMIRAAAKNHAYVAVATDPNDYVFLISQLKNGLDFELRQRLAAKAYARTAAYDSAISQWFCAQENVDQWPPYLLDAKRSEVLRYGENPHQSAAVFVREDAAATVVGAKQLQGKALSYNNINDTDAAWKLVQEFDAPAACIIKHANPSGAAVAKDISAAFHKALACDPVSAFGGILAVNRVVDVALVTAIGKLFLEVIIAPSFDDDALAILLSKKNLRLLQTGEGKSPANWQIKTVSGGYLVQEANTVTLDETQLKTLSKRAPSDAQMQDLRFAFAVCKHVKSNAIVLVKDGATVGIGAGQMSRVDSVRLACQKAKAAGLEVRGSVLASDAFFPFDDNVHHAAEAGVSAIIQPGGSIRDEEVIAAANQHDLAMVSTAIRHFSH